MNFAPDIRHKDAHTRLLELALVAYLTESLFDAVDTFMVRDEPGADTGLVAALRTGKILYREGYFHGPLTARISRELRGVGASIDRGTFYLAPDKLPIHLRAAAAEGRRRSEDLHRDLLAFLVSALGNMGPAPSGIGHENLALQILAELDGQWGEKTANTLAVEEYVLRAEAAAKALAEEVAQRLRSSVEDSQTLGQSRSELADVLNVQKALGRRRAHYVAEREIAAFIAGYRRLRAEGIGSPGYFWETQRDPRVRADHAHLQGQFFRWENPPITNTATGDRNHPGEDFNCRCFPRMLRKERTMPEAKRLSPVKQERVDNEAAVGQISA